MSSSHAASSHPLAAKVNQAVAEMVQDRFFLRMLQKDPLIWKEDVSHHAEIRNRLGWLWATETLAPKLHEILSFAEEIRREKFRFVAILGMGGSSLAPELFSALFAKKGYPQILIFDSTDPRRVRELCQKIGKQKTLVIFASKSGTTVESVSLFRHLEAGIEKAYPGRAGSFCAAITDPGLPLEKFAAEKKFRKVFLNPADVGGRFSALTYFGLVPAALAGADVRKVLRAAASALPSFLADRPDNEALQLGVWMAQAALAGRDKLTLALPKSWSLLGDWAEQLVAESTGKEGKGIVPVTGEALAGPSLYGGDRVFVHYAIGARNHAGDESKLKALYAAGHPVLRIRVRGPEEIGREFLRWEIATAVACAVFKVNPFDQPNVQEAKELTKSILAGKASVSTETQAWKGTPFKLRAGQAISASAATEAWSALWGGIKPGDYVNLLAFLPDCGPVRKGLAALSTAVRAKKGVPAIIGIGPRYLHSTGQLHKGGPDSGVFVVLISPLRKRAEDLKVPGESYSFEKLLLAQSWGDFAALDQRNRRVLMLVLPDLRPTTWLLLKKLLQKVL